MEGVSATAKACYAVIDDQIGRFESDLSQIHKRLGVSESKARRAIAELERAGFATVSPGPDATVNIVLNWSAS